MQMLIMALTQMVSRKENLEKSIFWGNKVDIILCRSVYLLYILYSKQKIWQLLLLTSKI
jgi:hypothetical protein